MAADLNSLEKSGLSLNERFIKASQTIGAVGRQLQLAGGIGTFALGLAANEAAKLQTQVTLAATQVGNTTAQVKDRATKDFQGILDQMTKFPQASSDMSAALYDIYSTLNVTGKQGIPILQQINKAATAGALTAKDAGSGLLSILSNFKQIPQTAAGAQKAFNTMFAAVRFGRVTMDQFATSLQTTAPAAKLAGQSLGSMAGTVAFLSRSLGANKASVGYARLVEVLSGPQMQEGLKKVGVNIDTQSGKLKNLDQVIQILVKRFPYLSQGGLKAINFFKDIGGIQSTIQARRAFATLVKDVGGYRMVLGKTVHDHNEFRKSYAVMAQSLGVQWAVFLNTLKSIAITIGSAVIPAFVQMSKPIREAVVWFQKLPQSTKDLIGKFAAFAAVGALVGGTLLTIIAGVAIAVASFGELAGAAAILGAGLATYIGFAAIGKKIYDNWNDLGPLFEKFAGYMKTVFTNLGQAAKAFYEGDWSGMWSHLGDAIKAAVPGVKAGLDLILKSVEDWGKEFVTTVQGAITAAFAIMFVAARRRGVGAGSERLLGGLSTADLMAPFFGGAGGPMGVGVKAAAKADDIKALGKYLPFMTTQEKMAYTELQTRQKIANTWKAQIKAQADAFTSRKQIAALDQVEAKKLYSFSNVASGRTQIMRTTGGFASAAESTAALAILNRAPAETGAAERGAAAAAVGFAKLRGGIAGAGTSLLQFIGFGNLWVGAGIAIVGGLVLLTSAFGKAGSAFQSASAGLQQLTDQLSKATDAFKNAADAQVQFGAAKTTLRQQTSQVARLQHIVQTATVGSKIYKRAEQELSVAQQARAQSLNVLIAAQQNLNSALSQGLGHSVSARTGLRQALANLPAARAASSPAVIAQRQQQFGFGTADPQVAQSRDQVKKLNDQIQASAVWLGKATGAFNEFARAGGNLSGGLALKSLTAISQILSETLVGSDKLAPSIVTLSQKLGRVITPQELKYFGELNKSILPGVSQFIATAHQLPGSTTTAFLQSHRNIQQSAGALVGTLGHLPTTQQVRFLVDHKQFDTQIANFIRKFHQLPDKKHMEIIINTVQAEQHLEKARQHVAHLQVNLHQIGRLRPDVQVNTSKFDQNIKKAQAQVRTLDKTVTTPHTKNYNIVWHPSIASAQSKASSLGAQLDAGVAAGITSNTVLLNSAMTAAVNGAVAAGVKAAKPGSPSKVTRKKIGDPMLQGILAGLTNKKAINDAANQAVSTMIDAFTSARSTFQDQMGVLFAGPTFLNPNKQPDNLQMKIDWGERLNIKDLSGDLNAQVRQFSNFQNSLRKLDRRKGTSFGFIDAIKQLGPAAQAEVDALLRATPKQLRQYEKLWEKSQKQVNNTASKEIKGQIAAYKKQGAAVALGFLDGIQSHSAQLARYFKNLFLHLFHQVKHTHKSHSPSQLYFEEGVNVMKGFQLGVQHQAHPLHMNPAMRPVGVGRHHRPLVASVTNNYYNRTYNVYPQKNENLLTALRKHDHITRHRP
jgi:TP901 family phage tail tape measure protein